MRIYVASIVFSLLFVCSGSSQNSDALFTAILHQYVKEGEVNYTDLCKDNRLSNYISELSKIDPDSLSTNSDKLAFWINAYNAYTLKIICDHYPVKSINDLHSGGTVLSHAFKTTIWDKEIVAINHKNTSLNNIEHKIIRPEFKDFRIHFALVCAAKSCPALRSEAYEGSTLDQQLDDQAKLFISDSSKNHFDAASRKASISKIFDWYRKDFGSDEAEVLRAISKYLPDQIRKSIQSPEKWEVDYTDYDWSLNE